MDQYVIDQMPQINRDLRNRLMAQPQPYGAAPTYQGAPAGTAPGYGPGYAAPSPSAPVPLPLGP